MSQHNDLQGAGPFEFRPDPLAPGETEIYDFRNLRFNGTKGGLKKYLPFDSAQVTNASTERLSVEYNERYSDVVVPNAVETYEKQGIVRVTITNDGDTTLNADDVVLSVTKEPYGADQRARDRQRQGTVSSVVEKFTGVKL